GKLLLFVPPDTSVDVLGTGSEFRILSHLIQRSLHVTVVQVCFHRNSKQRATRHNLYCTVSTNLFQSKNGSCVRHTGSVVERPSFVCLLEQVDIRLGGNLIQSFSGIVFNQMMFVSSIDFSACDRSVIEHFGTTTKEIV